ncbi:MAG: class I SAM-dependent methyltransferase [Bdellovibrionales bacterium]|nr:class I SAM-dependent methyltransferase [Bdellovibrionales bacterium]
MTNSDRDSELKPDSSAVRVALWRALHTQLENPPYIIEDNIGLQIANPEEGWQQRPDMHPQGTLGFRASIVGRTRFLEDLVLQSYNTGIFQYVILGAGLDSFAQRKSQNTSRLKIFEIDKPDAQKWKQQRLSALGYSHSDQLTFVPVDFEAGEFWLDKLVKHGFNMNEPAIISSTGVSMYLSKEANDHSLKQIASFAKRSILAMTFILPLELIDSKEHDQLKMVYEKAKEAGTPFISFFSPTDILDLALHAGFEKVEHVSRGEIIKKYFIDRSDNFKPSSGEEFLIATV